MIEPIHDWPEPGQEAMPAEQIPAHWGRATLPLGDHLTRYRFAAHWSAFAYREIGDWVERAHQCGFGKFGLRHVGRGCQVGWAYREEDRFLLIAVRGSEIGDAQRPLEGFRDWLLADAGSLFPRTWSRLPRRFDGGRLWMPAGFVWQSEAVISELQAMAKKHGFRINSGIKIFLTGHSLGGAVAKQVQAALRSAHPVCVSVDGARAFGKRAARWFWELELPCEDLINTSQGHLDIVPGVPAWAKLGGKIRLIVPEDRQILATPSVLNDWRQLRETFRQETPFYRPVTALVRRERNRIGPHLMRSVIKNLRTVTRVVTV